MKVEIDIPEQAIESAVRQAVLSHFFVNSGYSNERITDRFKKTVEEHASKAINALPLGDLIFKMVERHARETTEDEIKKIVSKMARDAIKAEMSKQTDLFNNKK